VHDADGVDDATMLAFARETRLSETTFVQSPRAPEADYRNRIWTVGWETAFAGHPSLGTAVAVAHRRGEPEARYVQETGAGLQPVEVSLRPNGRAHASMLQNEPEHLDLVDPAAVLAAAGLEPGDEHPELPAQVVSTGQPHLLAPLASAAALERAAPPSFAALRELLRSTSTEVLYLAWLDLDAGTAQARGFFADPGTVSEDPATGSAAGPLCAYAAARAGTRALVVEQGVAMGRPSRIACAMADDGRVRVSGDVVIVMTGDVAI
jgi:trans-2,3-dihydro-3-hydroxyanthranilate isomerase